ncbi:hypothetical protein CDAR_108471 [Caerostris darwini]|uniref:MADF domain-containing protein n=1 Tax=Caerostris darwini TaxID=1538125 RepID=A0AAV4UEN8_9ARAC|nr:hypothetical protein CDAR_108471 [Caerostris darwini]
MSELIFYRFKNLESSHLRMLYSNRCLPLHCSSHTREALGFKNRIEKMNSEDEDESTEVASVLTSKPKLDELKLIQLIKERPALYDSGHPKHRYRLYIDQLWNEIAVEMGAPVYDLRNKWHVLRCCFNRAMKEMQSGNRRSGRQWHLYNAMLFIKSYLRKRKIDDQSATENPHSLKQELLQGQDSVIDHDDLECDVSPPEASSPTTKHHLIIYDDGTTQLVPSSKRLKADLFSGPSDNFLFPSSKPKSTTEEANELFLRSILHDMSKLNPSKLRHFKTFVMTKLTHLLDEQDAEARDFADGLTNPYVLESTSVDP